MNHMIESFAGTGKSEPARSSRSRTAWVAGLLFLLCGLHGSFPGTGTAHAGAQAAPRIWTLEFKPGPLRMYVDPIDGKHYHYFTYRVINLTEGDRMFAPTLELFTDKGRLLAVADPGTSPMTNRTSWLTLGDVTGEYSQMSQMVIPILLVMAVYTAGVPGLPFLAAVLCGWGCLPILLLAHPPGEKPWPGTE